MYYRPPQPWWHKTIYCAHRFCRSDIGKRHSMAVLSLLHDVSGLNWEDSKDWPEGCLDIWVMIVPSDVCILAGRTGKLGLPAHDLSICLSFLSVWRPQVIRFPTKLSAQVFQWTRQKFTSFDEFLVSHILHLVGYKQVTKTPDLKGREFNFTS